MTHPVEASSLVERLRSDAAQLIRMAEATKFGDDLSVRVKAPDLLIGVLSEAATRIEQLERQLSGVEAERDGLAKIARDLTKGLVQLTPSGSEYFTWFGDEYYADVEACQRVVRERFESGHKAKIELVDARRDLQAAERQLATARNDALEEAAKALDARAEMLFVDYGDRVGQYACEDCAHLVRSLQSEGDRP